MTRFVCIGSATIAGVMLSSCGEDSRPVATARPSPSNHVEFAGINTNEMAFIPAGPSLMGNCMDTNEGSWWELPVHTVMVSAFYMDKCEVSKQLWDDVYLWAILNGYDFDHDGSANSPTHPVQNVNWYDCVKWCNARSEMEGLTPCYCQNRKKTTVYRTGLNNIGNNCGSSPN